MASRAFSMRRPSRANKYAKRLLRDMHAVFVESGADRLRSSDIIDAITKDVNSKWANWNGKKIGPTSLGLVLSEYGVSTRPTRFGDAVHRAYHRDDVMRAYRQCMQEWNMTMEEFEKALSNAAEAFTRDHIDELVAMSDDEFSDFAVKASGAVDRWILLRLCPNELATV